ncbi:MAG TPA: hypothetical protein VNP97_12955 [Microbacterium sp.]|nr:hypothetical protein [Microbacterium sp.]
MSSFRRYDDSARGGEPLVWETASEILTHRSQADPIARAEDDGVAVVIDGSVRSWSALQWGAAEAAARRTILTVIYPVRTSIAMDPLANPWTHPCAGDDEHAADVLREAASLVSRSMPGVAMRGYMAHGLTVPNVLEVASGSGLRVVGRPEGWDPLAAIVGDSVWAAARRLGRPVAIIDDGGAGLHGPWTGRVVVLVTGASDPRSALGVALRAAHRRGVGVTFVHMGARTRTPYFSRPAVDDAFRAAQDAFPEVHVLRRTVQGAVGPGVIRETAGAAIVVVGARGSAALFRALRSRDYRPGVPVVVA